MLKKFFKSKTVNFNILFTALIMILTQGFGIAISPEVIAAIGTLANLVLRSITKVPISEK